MVRPYNLSLKEPARKLRKAMTDAEQLLWYHLRGKQILGIQFHRQKPIGPYIVDFHAPAVNLVVEVDGAQHLDAEHLSADERRDLFLSNNGLLVLRFDDRQVLQETGAVLDEIFRACQERQIPPVPPSEKGGT
jgi:very-short-patch-repair endonuclease